MLSIHFSRLRTAVQTSVVEREVGIHDSIKVLIGQGKLWFGTPRLFHSLNYLSCTNLHVFRRPGFALAANSEFVNQRRVLSVVGTLSRTFSVPSISGPSLQNCGYHIDCALTESAQFSIFSNSQNKTMAAHLYSSNFCLSSRGLENCRKVSMRLKNQQLPGNPVIYGYYAYHVSKSCDSFYPYSESGSKGFHSASSTCFSTGPAPDVPFDTSTREDQLTSSADSSEQKTTSGKTLKLISGSCCLPHPEKEETGGEDAHFICTEEQVIGVADGVGGWAEVGVDAGIYSRQLMSNSVNAIKEEPKGSINPARVLEKAHSITKAKGSSTACIIALTDQGLHAINLGDSGFMVVRNGCTIFRSPVQQHDFNFTFQLESGSDGDLPSSGQVFTIPVAPGDVIIAGTDGLFDNLYNNEITAVVVHAIRAGLSPQVTAQKIAALARQRAQDKDRQTPFSTAAQDAGFRYYGGKLDDTTVVVSYISGSENA
ncbi:hypothetical protein L6164_024741 [Bauhinia variegata]|uniref:Uncharacterized protein n=1 Tax=Bauhinia variegata TaxID=167791 RepID=A0ACB9LYG7_BAUVA|nr:hypothetical protein L6164_024741 [Bauhinia variegata]